ncbi:MULTISPECIES: 2-(1,2-epoxy-1,2-dihydrophenyl)acetyl-CoA isomerase PaaG [unclassified Erwinia]|uniref:2-(1,2-epoxy-1,2-dihydrophenyl)acetyl-CoA isomerase PaaG n=1 Tax=unclassified Erwinia TaxID=2622719 RepID=UPI0009E920F2|nr:MULTISPECIES: 2-(1,2-epoxy-1,2-dihydrophenyl)acetyl-CoA isomerase PaaG [unclassified Erwinia]
MNETPNSPQASADGGQQAGEHQPPVLARLTHGVLQLTLNRPQRLNSFNPAMHLALAAALERAETDDAVRCVLLTGAGRAFCAGQDLSDRRTRPGDNPADLGLSVEKHYNPLIRRLTALPKPVVGAINGVAAGAGASLALACDLTLAARSASFLFSFCRVGLVPDSGASWFLPRKVGYARAAGMALLGDKIGAEQALNWGLIWQVWEDDQLENACMQLAQRLAGQATAALGMTKRALQAAATHTLSQQLDLERDLQQQAGRSDDYREGVNAFLTKRQAHFSGR